MVFSTVSSLSSPLYGHSWLHWAILLLLLVSSIAASCLLLISLAVPRLLTRYGYADKYVSVESVSISLLSGMTLKNLRVKDVDIIQAFLTTVYPSAGKYAGAPYHDHDTDHDKDDDTLPPLPDVTSLSIHSLNVSISLRRCPITAKGWTVTCLILPLLSLNVQGLHAVGRKVYEKDDTYTYDFEQVKEWLTTLGKVRKNDQTLGHEPEFSTRTSTEP